MTARRHPQSRFLRALWFVARALLNQRSLIFRPSRREVGTPADLRIEYEDVSLVLPRGERLRAWWIPAAADATLLLLPGRRSNISCELAATRYFQSLPCNVLAVDYPGFGRSEGRPSEAGCEAAVLAAWEHLTRERGIAPQEIALYGRSLGAVMAAWLAARVSCRGLIFHGGFSSVPDLARRYFPAWIVALLCRTRLDVRDSLSACRCPVLFLHGREDHVIPLAEIEALLSLVAAPRQLVLVDGDHWGSEWTSSAEARECIRGLFTRSLAGKP